jgi:hypothetical protein
LWRLELVPVLSGQAAVGEDALPSPPRPNFRKGRQDADCNAGRCGGKMGRGVFRGGHGKGKEDGVGIQAGR